MVEKLVTDRYPCVIAAVMPDFGGGIRRIISTESSRRGSAVELLCENDITKNGIIRPYTVHLMPTMLVGTVDELTAYFREALLVAIQRRNISSDLIEDERQQIRKAGFTKLTELGMTYPEATGKCLNNDDKLLN